MNKPDLIGYFRKTDKTSDVIGTRQAAVFQTLRGVAGREPVGNAAKAAAKPNTTKPKQRVTSAANVKTKSPEPAAAPPTTPKMPPKRDMALTVRVEINLPAEASAETYDNIFKSIKANLLND